MNDAFSAERRDFEVRLYRQTGGGYRFVGDTFLFPSLPYPGLLLIHEASIWRVERLQVMIAQRGSMAEGNGSPIMVEVIVTEAEGIFAEDDDPAEGPTP